MCDKLVECALCIENVDKKIQLYFHVAFYWLINFQNNLNISIDSFS